jgi:dephospho-CoA kinase
LTGGIATGKSLVAEVFQERGAFILDSDKLGHELMEPGMPAFHEIRRSFGEGILDLDGKIDRKKLGSRVFQDETARRRLNEILHPLILAEAHRRVADLAERSPGSIVVTQAALLMEAGVVKRFDRIVMTDCDAESQIRRLIDRDAISAEEALRRVRAQADPAQRRKIADILVDTSGTPEESRANASQAFDKLRREWEALRSKP